MTITRPIQIITTSFSFFIALFLSGCENDDPAREDTPELITQVTLTFTPPGSSPITVTATDPDGEGIQDLIVDGPINLAKNTTYTLTLELINGLANPADPAYNITEEVEEESDEHLFFFAWTNNTFSDPAGDGNIDNRSDAVNYNDTDANGLPVGLSTTWTTTDVSASGTFRVILKHQPNLKSATSTATMGESDVDLTFTLNVN
ncbi:MAG TPA: hypothetical protein PKH83_05565 [Cyclobacteriaceae bacterium]|nr:hypothetical protein [Cyclobacteriaceae bacterium]HNU41939.1 hypothetical protein [Cyclobacteriaceae bacterium]